MRGENRLKGDTARTFAILTPFATLAWYSNWGATEQSFRTTIFVFSFGEYFELSFKILIFLGIQLYAFFKSEDSHTAAIMTIMNAGVLIISNLIESIIRGVCLFERCFKVIAEGHRGEIGSFFAVSTLVSLLLPTFLFGFRYLYLAFKEKRIKKVR